MIKLIKFTDADDHKDIWINPDHIVAVHTSGNAPTTIVPVTGYAIQISDPAANVVATLRGYIPS